MQTNVAPGVGGQHPLAALQASIERVKAAPLLHKGEVAGEALDALMQVLLDVDGRLAVLEGRLNAIEHPPAQLARPRRDPTGRFS